MKNSKLIFPLSIMGLAILSGCHGRSSRSAYADSATTASPVIEHPAFDADRAYVYLKAQCDMGPRPPRSDAHNRCRDYIINQLKPVTDQIVRQDFYIRDPARHVRMPLTNIIGMINPKASKQIMLVTHWDTRPTADNELEDDDKKKPIIGADDGASGTAILLELAHTFHDKHPDVGVILLFVDGEDWGPGENMMYLGARHYVKDKESYKPAYAILLDMVGDKDLAIHREATSEQLQPEINNKIWKVAGQLGYRQYFPNDTKYQISDDHDSLNAGGIPTVDLIDFDYAYWHTLSDTADKCSPGSLKIVGEVVAQVIYNEH